MAQVAGATCGQLNGTAAIRLSHPRLLSGTKPEPSIWRSLSQPAAFLPATTSPDFPGFSGSAALRLCFAGGEKTRTSGGTLKARFHPELLRHARRRNPVLVSPQPAEQEPTSVPGFPCPLLLAPCPSFPRSLLLVPCSLVPRPPSSGRRLQWTGRVFTTSGRCGLPSQEGQNRPRKPLDSVRKTMYDFLHERQNEITPGS